MTDAARIKLAKAMGWAEAAHPQNKNYRRWIDPTNNGRKVSDQQLPDPFTDANDCEAVMDRFRQKGYGWTIESWPDGDSVSLYRMIAKDVAVGDFIDHWEGGVSSTGRDNWKRGVCELTLKVINDD